MDEHSTITIPFNVTPAEIDTWQVLTVKQKNALLLKGWMRRILLGVYFAIAVLFVLLNPRHGTPASLPEAACIAGVLFVVVLIYSWLSDRNANNIAIRRRSTAGEFAYLLAYRSVTLRKRGILVESDADTAEYPWQKVRKITFTTSGMIFLEFDENKACIIPRTAFSTRTAANMFYERTMREYEANRTVTRSYTVSKTNLRPRL